MKQYDVVIVGAGAAGMMAAGRVAEQGCRVLLLEKMERPGRKLLITGKGRCNITNAAPLSEFYKHIYPNGRFLKHAFHEFFTDDIVQLLNNYGVETVVERGDRVFPKSNLASDVQQALLSYAKKPNVDILFGCRVEKLIVEGNSIAGVLFTKNNVREQIQTKAVILCTGGNSYPATGSSGDGYHLVKPLNIQVVPVRPALVPIETAGGLAGQLQGLSLKNVNAVLWSNGKKLKEEFGEMLFTHFGLSGPIILTLSRFVVDEFNKKVPVEISIDLKPALDEQKLDARLLRDLNEHGKKQMENLFRLWLPSKLIDVFIGLTGIDPKKEAHQVNAAERKKIRLLMKDFRFVVSGYRSFKEAIITAGGISADEIDSKTMASKKIQNLFFAGEIIDCDADTGGFNLQIAFSTAWLAAKSCAEVVKPQ